MECDNCKKNSMISFLIPIEKSCSNCSKQKKLSNSSSLFEFKDISLCHSCKKSLLNKSVEKKRELKMESMIESIVKRVKLIHQNIIEEIPKQNIKNNELQLSFNLSKRKKYENINEEIPPGTNAQTPKKLDDTNNEVPSSFEKDRAWLIEIGEIIESKKDLFQNAQTINENAFTEISELVGKIVEIFFLKYKNFQLNITPDIILLGQNIKNGIKSINNERNFLKNEHFSLTEKKINNISKKNNENLNSNLNDKNQEELLALNKRKKTNFSKQKVYKEVTFENTHSKTKVSFQMYKDNFLNDKGLSNCLLTETSVDEDIGTDDEIIHNSTKFLFNEISKAIEKMKVKKKEARVCK